ncbi:hypothetical protein FRC17_004034 [Serendipita sp. 399]|nr:hypothetical protein FRC17_004034 [Serendipita sp. 399]
MTRRRGEDSPPLPPPLSLSARLPPRPQVARRTSVTSSAGTGTATGAGTGIGTGTSGVGGGGTQSRRSSYSSSTTNVVGTAVGRPHSSSFSHEWQQQQSSTGGGTAIETKMEGLTMEDHQAKVEEEEEGEYVRASSRKTTPANSVASSTSTLRSTSTLKSAATSASRTSTTTILPATSTSASSPAAMRTPTPTPRSTPTPTRTRVMTSPAPAPAPTSPPAPTPTLASILSAKYTAAPLSTSTSSSPSSMGPGVGMGAIMTMMTRMNPVDSGGGGTEMEKKTSRRSRSQMTTTMIQQNPEQVVDSRLQATTTAEMNKRGLSETERQFVYEVWERRIRRLMTIGRLEAKKNEVTSLLDTLARGSAHSSRPPSSTTDEGAVVVMDRQREQLLRVQNEVEWMLGEVMKQFKKEEEDMEEEARRRFYHHGASHPPTHPNPSTTIDVDMGGTTRMGTTMKGDAGEVMARLKRMQERVEKVVAASGIVGGGKHGGESKETTGAQIPKRAKKGRDEKEEGEADGDGDRDKRGEGEERMAEEEMNQLEEMVDKLGWDLDDVVGYGIEEGLIMVEEEVNKLGKSGRLEEERKRQAVAAAAAVKHRESGLGKEEMEEVIGMEMEMRAEEGGWTWKEKEGGGVGGEVEQTMGDVREYVRRLKGRRERARAELEEGKEKVKRMKEKIAMAERRLQELVGRQSQQALAAQSSPRPPQSLMLLGKDVALKAARHVEQEWTQKMQEMQQSVHVGGNEAKEEWRGRKQSVMNEEMARWKGEQPQPQQPSSQGMEGVEGGKMVGDQERVLLGVAASLEQTLQWQNVVAEYLNGQGKGIGDGPGGSAAGTGAVTGTGVGHGGGHSGLTRARI